MLPALKNYVPSVTLEGTRDVRVVDRAKTLWVAVWLHQLDMAEGGKALASETLEASRHCLGLLLESFLTPKTSNLTFQEVVDCVLGENRWASQQSLHHLRGCRIHNCEVLDRLIKAHRELDKSNKATQKSLKKEIDQRRKSLEMLKECISYYEMQLGQEPSEGNTPMMMASLVTVHRLRWLLHRELMMLLQRAPRLQPLIPLQLRTKPRTWRWMMMVFAHIYPAPSPGRMTIY